MDSEHSGYSGKFYSLRNQETSYDAGQIFSILLKQINGIHSAIDVGCGVGTFLSVLEKHGVNDILGLDGEWVDKNMLVIPDNKFQTANLTTPPNINKKYDLAICLEVAEHLPAKNAEKFVEWLCGLSDVVLFSAAVPQQGGVNHVNEMWQSYWADLFLKNGFYSADLVRPQIWTDKKIAFWYKQNTLVYIRKGSRFFSNQECPFPLDVIHPELYLMRANSCGLFKRLFRRLTRHNG